MNKSKLPLSSCLGCVDDFYNGKNDLGVEECRMRDDAKLDDYALIHKYALPPYTGLEFKKMPVCYRASEFVKIKKTALDSEGYWK